MGDPQPLPQQPQPPPLPRWHRHSPPAPAAQPGGDRDCRPGRPIPSPPPARRGHAPLPRSANEARGPPPTSSGPKTKARGRPSAHVMVRAPPPLPEEQRSVGLTLHVPGGTD